MIVETWMSRDPFTIDVNATARDAVRLMTDHGLRRLPVLRDGHLAGVVTRSDLVRGEAIDPFSLAAHGSRAPSRAIGALMSSPAVTTTPTTALEDAARLMIERKIGALPVVRESGSLLGILTESDVLRALICSLHVPGRSTRMVFDGTDPDDLIALLVARARPLGLSIASVLRTTSDAGREVVITVVGADGHRLADLAWKAGYRVKSMVERSR